METVEIISLMLGAAWASGINLYAAVLVLGWLGGAGHVDLPPGLDILSDPLVMLAAGAMYAIEFFTDKIPGVDSAWDALHTFVRIPAGALMAAGAAQGLDVGQAAELAALLLGGGVAAASHTAKAGSRVVINTSPEPFSNWGASLAEDLTVVAGLWAALNHPWLFIIALVVFLSLLAWLLPKLWRALRKSFRAVRRWFSGDAPSDQAAPKPTSSERNPNPKAESS
jgi:Sec-independent protein translocase protein TatA